MSAMYKRLGTQGEVHLAKDGKKTLCGIMTTHPNWIDNVELTDKDPLMCVDCLNANKPKEEKKEAKPKAKKEETK